MSDLLEILGRGLIAHLSGAFRGVLGTDTDVSTEDLVRTIEAEPGNTEARIRLAGRYLRDDDPISARRVFLEILEQDEASLAARLGLACAYDELGQVESSLEQLRITQKQDPLNPAILFCIGYTSS